MSPTPTQTIRVLHVDDDPAFAALTAAYLPRERPEITVTSVDSPAAVLACFEENPPDCVVSDYDMPGRSGLALLRDVRDTRPELPFVLFTGKGSEEVAAEAIQYGVSGYVQKGGTEKFGLLATQIHNAVTAARAERERRKRTKELSTLYDATFALWADEPLAERLRGLARSLPGGWRYPLETAARITVGGEEYATPNFAETDRGQRTALSTSKGTEIEIEVVYVGPHRPNEPPFADEEQSLLESVGSLLRAHLEREEAVDELRRANQQLRSLLDNTSALVYMKDVEGRYLLVNEAYERRIGLPNEEILGRTAHDVLPEEAAGMVHEHDQEAISRGEPVEFEERLGMDDEVRTYLSTRVPLHDATGEPYAVYGISSDVTAQAGQLSEIERTIDRMTDAFFAVDERWRFTYVNPRAEALLEREADDLLGVTLWAAFPEARETAFFDRYRHAMERQETVTFEARYEPLEAVFEVRAHPSETGLSVYFRDVTRDRAVQDELEESVATLHELYELTSTPDLAFEEKIERVLELGCDRLELPYGFLTRLTDRTQSIVAARGDHELLRTGSSCPIERSYCRKTVETGGLLAIDDAIERGWADDAAYGEFELGCYVGGTVIVNEEFYGTLCFAATSPRERDFTDSERTFVELVSRWMGYELERRRHQEEVNRHNERLERFAGVVSHDLRSPLSIVAGRLELARTERDDENLASASKALERTSAIVDDALEFARLGREGVDRRPVSLAGVVEAAWNVAGNDAATLRFDEDFGAVDCDPRQLQRALENVFRNAVDHAGSGVCVRVGELTRSEGFYVADDGPGVPPAERSTVFEYGHTSSRSGTGLGLAIVREIVAAHGWSVGVTESETGGARFEFVTS